MKESVAFRVLGAKKMTEQFKLGKGEVLLTQLVKEGLWVLVKLLQDMYGEKVKKHVTVCALQCGAKTKASLEECTDNMVGEEEIALLLEERTEGGTVWEDLLLNVKTEKLAIEMLESHKKLEEAGERRLGLAMEWSGGVS
jgi:hypothetical protein